MAKSPTATNGESSEATATSEATAPAVNSAPSVKGDGKATPKSIASSILELTKQAPTPEVAASVKRLAKSLHQVNGATTPELKAAVDSFYRDPSAANAAEVSKAIRSQKFDG